VFLLILKRDRNRRVQKRPNKNHLIITTILEHFGEDAFGHGHASE
jgi:hypothetical protein